MTYRTRIKYTAEQKDEMWDRWQRGESLKAIGRVFDRPSSSIFGQLATHGGIRPPTRPTRAPTGHKGAEVLCRSHVHHFND